jgi:hypothetical protein
MISLYIIFSQHYNTLWVNIFEWTIEKFLLGFKGHSESFMYGLHMYILIIYEVTIMRHLGF